MENRRLRILFLSLIFVIIALISGLILYFNVNKNNQTEDISSDTIFPTRVPVMYKSPTIVSNTPLFTEALLPGKNQIFTIVFNESIADKKIKILLTKLPTGEPEENSMSVEISSEVKDKGKTLLVQTQEQIQPFHEYSLIILDKNNETLISITYISGNIEITKAEQNNLDLRGFLPRETPNYKLTYNEESNTYIFNFKYNAQSDVPIQTQYETAKQQAEEFIRSSGIDLNSIVIEWRHS